MTLKISGLDSFKRIADIRIRADETINGVFEESAAVLEEYAKQNAPWTDRTGNARRTLQGVSLCFPFKSKKVSIVGKMHYSPNLELSYGGRYSILFPTVLENARDILKSVVKELGGVSL